MQRKTELTNEKQRKNSCQITRFFLITDKIDYRTLHQNWPIGHYCRAVTSILRYEWNISPSIYIFYSEFPGLIGFEIPQVGVSGVQIKRLSWKGVNAIFFAIRGCFQIYVLETKRVSCILFFLKRECGTWTQGYKTFFTLNSVEHEIFWMLISIKISRNSAFFRLR